ncbi:RagB/SusD family nutrient uptake outer membrane protein [Chitinophaga silvatica]|uniref:RagB/SusD family nutrient uptake outer membrane protein n=1 Tax=Chitinophaga silvatica TaxID=2282649 RepID=A0A3E1Y2B0_9BACT|nr:RagB/SusD family nutrient uptake outer membrane protein [Chitinophaga silvatica]RFS18812.1 RagB/SusD family nutrient uptake outer membrane protein [Chitinophaga silvatica]
MKKSIYQFLFAAAGSLMLTTSSCNKKLEEHPYTVFTKDYFKTTEGWQNAIYALYSGMRYNFGPEGATGIGVDGTDEFTYGEQPRNGAGGTADYLTLGNYTLDFANGAIQTPWNRNYSNINLANAVVDFASFVNLPDAVKAPKLGEARFLRAQYYMLLVQQFGAVPVDLGSGDLKFNEQPYQGFNRLPVNEILVKNYNAIIEDLIFASQNLPDKRSEKAFNLSKAAAFHLLAKAYIHRGYSAAKQPDDFNKAYAAATEVINNPAKYGVALQANYADVHKPGNDYNSEILYAVERIPGNNIANEVGDPGSIGGSKGIDANNDFVGDYTSVRAPLNSSSTQPVSTRTPTYGRPIRRFCPTKWLYETAFADKDNDSRYDGSFRTVYMASVTGGGFTADKDTAFILAKTDRIADSLNGIKPAGARLVPYRVISPSEFYIISGSTDATATRNMYPSLSKYEDPAKLAANDQGGRPFVVSKFSELYLLAAEAALKAGHPDDAVTYINVLKLRAASRAGLSSTEIQTRYNRIKVNSVAEITLDFILDERTRELCGETSRWPDLAVRGVLVDRVKKNNPDGAARIQSFHMLRPIPKGQLDAVADDDKAKYQNPGYN